MKKLSFKILGLAAFATMFAGVSFGQTIASCTGAAANPGPASVRAEGTTELVADFIWNCPITAPAAGQSANISVFFNASVTSRALTAVFQPGNTTGTATAASEAVLWVCSTAAACNSANSNNPTVLGGAATAAPGAGGLPYYGIANGTQLAFQNVSVPNSATIYFRVQNIRLNASAVALGATLTSLTAQPLVSMNNSTGTITGGNGTTPISYIFKSLAAPALNQFANATLNGTAINGAAATPQVNSYTTCAGNALPTSGTLAGPAFSVNVAENTVGVKAWRALAGEGGDYVNAGTGAGSASFGTHVQLVFGSVPAGVTIYVPVVVTGSSAMTANGAGFSMTAALPNSPGAGLTASTATGVPAGFAGVTATNGTVTVVYEVTNSQTAIQESATIPVYLAFAKNAFTTAQGPITVVEGLGAQAAAAAATTIPNFAPVSAPVLNGSTISLCSTNLLFPFVTSALGFDTGIALADTSADPFGTVASPGSCNLNFYGSGAPSPSTGVAAPNGSQNAGTVNAFLLSSVAPGFTGYVIAQCNYNFGHGFAYIVYSLTQNNGVSMGYLPLILPNRATGAASEALLN